MTKKFTTVKQAILTLALISLFCTKILFTFKHLPKGKLYPLPVLFLGTGHYFFDMGGVRGLVYKKGRLIPTAKRGKEKKTVKLKQVQYIIEG